ncbi:unnamed protein product [Blepharisma stoltei]|uniref:Uncharacterized protein n=1 Tax=Blepharisma stoltei TaxID=1481888 RepID=A0AAU9K520_9CILI|nr:unnamed protein product [Blepharisma stoltei]
MNTHSIPALIEKSSNDSESCEDNAMGDIIEEVIEINKKLADISIKSPTMEQEMPQRIIAENPFAPIRKGNHKC